MELWLCLGGKSFFPFIFLCITFVVDERGQVLPHISIGLTSNSLLCSTFINKVFNFIGIGVALYTVALVYGWASNDSVIKHTVKCKYCRKRISEKVVNSFP